MKTHGGIRNYTPTTATNQIVLLATPVSCLKAMGITKPIDIVAHWTIRINGWCYELARQFDKKFPYYYRSMPEGEWRTYRERQQKPVEQHVVGHMTVPYTHEIIEEVGKCTPSCLMAQNLFSIQLANIVSRLSLGKNARKEVRSPRV